MKKLLLLLLCVPLMFSCGEKEEKKDNTENTEKKEENVQKEEKEEKETIIKEIRVHSSDKKHTYVNRKRYYEGNLFTGVFFNTYDNGQLSYEHNYKDGEGNGTWRFYYKNGQLDREWYLKDGKHVGVSKFYSDNGQLEMEIHYKDGIAMKRSCWLSGKVIHNCPSSTCSSESGYSEFIELEENKIAECRYRNWYTNRGGHAE